MLAVNLELLAIDPVVAREHLPAPLEIRPVEDRDPRPCHPSGTGTRKQVRPSRQGDGAGWRDS
jgi:hypothetical protein